MVAARPHRKAVRILLVLLAAGFAVRMALAPHQGHPGDLSMSEGWMRDMAHNGIIQTYADEKNGYSPAYPPVLLSTFGITGNVYRFLVSSKYEVIQPWHRITFKLTPIAADLLLAGLFFFLFSRWRNTKAGLIAAGVWLFNPAVLHDSAMWGQTDAVYMVFLLAAIAALFFQRSLLSGALLALAVLCKPQSVIFFPLLFLLLTPHPRRIIATVLGGAATSALILAPFWRQGVLEKITGLYMVAELSNRISWNAYNFWWLVVGREAWNISARDEWISFLSYRDVGILLVGLCLAGIVFLFWHILRQKRPNPEQVLLVLALFSSAFFLFATGMHERYSYAFLAFGLPLVFREKSGIAIYALTSLAILLNNEAVTPLGSFDANWQHDPVFGRAVSIAQLILFAAFAWHMRSLMRFPRMRTS